MKANSLAPRTVAALAGLGRVAVAKRDYAQAVKYLEDALAIDPEAESLHAPLAAAYRGLGQLDKAQPHLRQWRNRDLPLPDPLQQELDLLLESGLLVRAARRSRLESRGLAQGAAEFFRKGIELSPSTTALSAVAASQARDRALSDRRHRRRAVQQFEEVVRRAPPAGVDEATAKAHYSLGVLLASTGDAQPAVEHLLAAVRYQPNYVEAHMALADVLRGSGRAEAPCRITRWPRINPRPIRPPRLRDRAGAAGPLRRGSRLAGRIGAALRRSSGFEDRARQAPRHERRRRPRRGPRAVHRAADVQCGQKEHVARRDDRDGAGGAGELRTGDHHPARCDGGRPASRSDRIGSAHGREPRVVRKTSALPGPVVRRRPCLGTHHSRDGHDVESSLSRPGFIEQLETFDAFALSH